MFDRFKAKAEAVSAEVVRVESRAAALDKVLEVLAREQVADVPGARAVWREGPLLSPLDHAALQAKVPGLTFEVTRESAAQSRVGVTEFEWAIAETGTLAQDATDLALRLASSLPETHVALVRVGSLVPHLAALLTRVDPRKMRYLALVTGPSRTADIERVLTIGVHGPKKLFIVAIDEEARA
jgi:L-lactate dehydrogenase complex protein LldG